MRDKDFTLNDLIWDVFDLPIEEDVDSIDFLTLDEVKAEMAKRINELNKIGYALSLNNIVEWEIRNNTETTAGIQPKVKHGYLFVISKYAARRRNEKYFDMIFYHELCHMLQIEYLFNSGFIYYDDHGKLLPDLGQEEYVYNSLKVSAGHTMLWRAFTNKVNQVLKVNPPITSTPSDDQLADIFSESFYNNSKEYEDFEFEGFFDYFPEVMK